MLVIERNESPEIKETLFLIEIKVALLPGKVYPDMLISITNNTRPTTKQLDNDYALALLKQAVENITQLQISQQ